jgi:hypothetical protein
MKRVWHKPAVLLMWLALPTAAWIYWRVWDQLPARMAVHFDANWQPNGYTSREGAAQLGLEILLIMLVLFTVTTLIVDAFKPDAFGPALVVSYAVLGFCCYGNYSIVAFNLKAPAGVFRIQGTDIQKHFPVLSRKLHVANAGNGSEFAELSTGY